MSYAEKLASLIHQHYSHFSPAFFVDKEQLTIEIPREHLVNFCLALRDDENLKFEQLMDVAGVDYSEYGLSEWVTRSATETGFERAVTREEHHDVSPVWTKPRFAVVYQLLSITLNQRIRLRTFADNEQPAVDSVISVWASANWNEREAFDLYGIIFHGHPDLRRILTDYGFMGYPFRKDFPLIGDVEMRYDAEQGRCIYEPVSIEPRVLVPRVIRDEHAEGNQ